MISKVDDIKGADATAGSMRSFLHRMGRVDPMREATKILQSNALLTMREVMSDWCPTK